MEENKTQPAIPVFNWLAKNKRLTKGLRELFETKIKQDENPLTFVTMRLGTKWADRLSPGDKVAISISNNVSKNLNVIGYAKVRMVKKCLTYQLSDDDKDLQKNIGAKTWDQVGADMREVYGVDAFIDSRSVITIIEFMVIHKHFVRK